MPEQLLPREAAGDGRGSVRGGFDRGGALAPRDAQWAAARDTVRPSDRELLEYARDSLTDSLAEKFDSLAELHAAKGVDRRALVHFWEACHVSERLADDIEFPECVIVWPWGKYLGADSVEMRLTDHAAGVGLYEC